MIGGIGAYSIDGDFATAPYGTTLGPIAKGRFATVRIDKPGQGDSEGPSYTDLPFEVEQDAYLQALRLAKTFPFVDKNRIAIFGHSMGGAFGPLVAAEEPVAGVAVMGTMIKTWMEYTLENTRRQSLLAGASAEQVDQSIRQLSGLLHYLYNMGMSPEQIIKEKPEYAAMMRQMSPDLKTYSGVGLPFFQKLSTINLPAAWAKFEGKALSLWGENDFISTEYDHQFLADIMNARRPGSGEFVRVPQTDHGFFMTSSQKDSQQKWGKPGNTYNPKTLEVLTDWLNRLFPA
jgi:pimeloyl-ACP methyl ester carboxylesterase